MEKRLLPVQSMKVLIVDDEPLAQEALATTLEARGDVEAYAVAADPEEALEKLSAADYDVVLLDINLPDLSGIELLDRIRSTTDRVPAVVFVTAHDRYAIAAFEKHAVDYVLKPFSAERIQQALDTAVRRNEAERATRLVAFLSDVQARNPSQPQRIAIKSKGRILFLDPAEILAVQAEGNYVLLLRETGSHLLRESISDIAEQLKPYGFIRIHRSILVNAAYVQEIQPCPTGEYALRLKSGKEYTVTRTYKKNLKGLAQYWVGTDRFLDGLET